ncbi:MAG TPA: ATP-binding cassette domain-containing protein, partial [Labilithrix sp.]|nr:ATP-binding cassette domain-containing protein [Labilithrix sp.]
IGASPSARARGAFAHWLAIVRASPLSLSSLGRLALLSLFLFALGVTGPLLTRWLIDTALPNIERATLRIIVLVTLVVAFHRAFASWLRDRAALFIDAQAEGEFLRLVFERLIRKPWSSRRATGVGELQQILASGEAFASALAKSLLTPLLDASLALGYLGVLAWLSPVFALAAFGATLVYLGLAFVLSRRVLAHQRVEIATLAAERAALLELIGGLPTLRVAGAEDFALTSWRRSFSAYQRASVRRADAESLSHHCLELVERVTLGSILMGGAYLCLHGRASVGELLGALAALGAYATALQGFSDAVVRWSTLSGHTERLSETLSAPAPDVAAPTKGRRLSKLVRTPLGQDNAHGHDDAIVLDNVWFRHGPDAPWLMQDFSMRIRRGTMTELRWPSGSGKTTLLRMLAGLLTPERGVISVDRMDPAHAREHVLYLPQDAHLFSGSVLENLRLLSGGASRERIARAAATTGLAATVATWPMGFETLVSSRGANVSGGQRQLILLTAAVASDRPILLLDESLANVDRIQRVMIQDAKMFEGRTVLSVVHDGVRELKDVPPDA